MDVLILQSPAIVLLRIFTLEKLANALLETYVSGFIVYTNFKLKTAQMSKAKCPATEEWRKQFIFTKRLSNSEN